MKLLRILNVSVFVLGILSWVHIGFLLLAIPLAILDIIGWIVLKIRDKANAKKLRKQKEEEERIAIAHAPLSNEELRDGINVYIAAQLMTSSLTTLSHSQKEALRRLKTYSFYAENVILKNPIKLDNSENLFIFVLYY